MIRNLSFIFFAVSLMLLGACSSDEPMVVPGADGSTTLNLLIPAPEMAHANTRAVDNAHGDALASEGTVKTLGVVGFYTEGTTKKHFYADLTGVAADAEVQDVYRSYKIGVVPGDYTLYVFANTPVSTALKSKLTATTTASGLENEVKALAYSYDALPTASTGLPMAKSLNTTVAENQTKQVVVDLEYVCSKVRLTVIYDNGYGNGRTFRINGMDANNVYTPGKLFPAAGENATGATKKTFANAGSPAHFDLPDSQTGKDLSFWTTMPAEGAADPLDGFTSKKTGNDEWATFAWQNTVYLPECKGKTSESTYLELDSPKGKAKVNIGCAGATDDHSANTGGDLLRGNFYDVVAMVADNGEITSEVRVQKWTPVTLAVQLAGLSKLYLSKTVIEETLTGNSPVEIAYESDAPKLVFESDKVKFTGMAEEVDLFKVTENPTTHTLTVSVNPDLPIYQGDDLVNKGFWVISGSIRKRVVISKVDLSAFLRILPASQSVSVQNIANEAKYEMYFDYGTNAPGLTLKLTGYSNTNTLKNYDPSGTPAGIYLEVCTPDSVAVTNKLELSNNLNLMDASNLLPGKSIPEDGYIRLTIADPTNAKYYAKQIKGTFEATAEGNLKATGAFSIEPNPTVYTIHFKAINGTNWGMPHIYVYQALYYNNYPVFGSSGSNNINWIEYSFTGNRAFRGWASDNGEIDDLEIGVTAFNDGGGSPVVGYHVGSSWGDPGNGQGLPDGENGYYYEVELIKRSSSSCESCRDNGSFKLWPGVGMTEEENGWWKIDLPLLVKPGTAMVMFTDGHSTDSNTRYPGGGVPGIPVPDYSDKEAWYLLDQSRGGDQCAFSDDERNTYAVDSSNE